MRLKTTSVIVCLLLACPLWAKKKQASLGSCKSELAAQIPCRAFDATKDSLLVCFWEIDSLSDTDQRWEIRYSQAKWTQQYFSWSCEKKMIQRKILFLFKQTKFTTEPQIRRSNFNFQTTTNAILAQLDSLSKSLPSKNLDTETKHYYQLEWICSSQNRSYFVPINDAVLLPPTDPISQMVQIFEQAAIVK